MKLDVGCGDKPRGDVNCDLFTGASRHFTDEEHGLIDPKQIPNFVNCDSHYLPFRSNSFDVVIGNHLLEHCKHPYDVLKARALRIKRGFELDGYRMQGEVEFQHYSGFLLDDPTPDRKTWQGIEDSKTKIKKSLETLNMKQLKFLTDKHNIQVKGQIVQGFFDSHRKAPTKRQYINKLAAVVSEKELSSLHEG